MADTIKLWLGMCWDILGIEFQLFEYTLTLRQILLFAIVGYGVAFLVFGVIFGKFGGGE